MSKFINNLFVALCVVVVVMVDCGLAVAGMQFYMRYGQSELVVLMVELLTVVLAALGIDFCILALYVKAEELVQHIAQRMSKRINWQIEHTRRTTREIKWQFGLTQAQREEWMPWTYADGSVYAQFIKWASQHTSLIQS
jgi:hypothetical protein